MLFHAHAPALPGGFLGVDVFFVISGFLIASQLIKEQQQTSRIRLGFFYRQTPGQIAAGLVGPPALCPEPEPAGPEPSVHSPLVAGAVGCVVGWGQLGQGIQLASSRTHGAHLVTRH
jgi:hypothetical protein